MRFGPRAFRIARVAAERYLRLKSHVSFHPFPCFAAIDEMVSPRLATSVQCAGTVLLGGFGVVPPPLLGGGPVSTGPGTDVGGATFTGYGGDPSLASAKLQRDHS